MKASEQFFDEISIIGLREARAERLWTLKFIWYFAVLLGLGSTGYFIFKVMEEYSLNRTATRIIYYKTNIMEFPPISFCPPHWVDVRKVEYTNLSEGALMYAFSTLPFEKMIKINCSKIAEKDKVEFHHFLKQNAMSSFTDFFFSVMFDVGDLFVGCQRCLLEKATKHFSFTGVCYSILFQPMDNRKFSTEEPRSILVNNEIASKTLPYLTPTKSYRIQVDPDKQDWLTAKKELALEPKITQTLYITSTVRQLLDKPNGRCLQKAPTTYSDNFCITNCYLHEMNRNCAACYSLGLFEGPGDNSARYPLCQVCGLNKIEKFSECHTDDDAVIFDCVSQCPPNCYQMLYQASMVKYARWIPESESEYESTTRNATHLLVYYEVGLNGIEIQEEYDAYSMETLISNVGGVLGLWVGASAMTVIQIIMFFVQKLYYKIVSVCSRNVKHS